MQRGSSGDNQSVDRDTLSPRRPRLPHSRYQTWSETKCLQGVKTTTAVPDIPPPPPPPPPTAFYTSRWPGAGTHVDNPSVNKQSSELRNDGQDFFDAGRFLK